MATEPRRERQANLLESPGLPREHQRAAISVPCNRLIPTYPDQGRVLRLHRSGEEPILDNREGKRSGSRGQSKTVTVKPGALGRGELFFSNEIAWDLGEKLPVEEILDLVHVLVQEIVAGLTKIIR